MVAGALAAVSAAVLASFFGVAGTVIGAALVSVVSTTGSAVYSASLSRTTERLRKVRTQLGGGRGTASEDPAGDDTATRVLPAHLDPRRPAPAPRSLLARVRWPRVAAYTAAVFGIAMAIVTGIELIGKEPVSALVGGSETSRSSTTLSELVTASSSSDTTPSSPGTTSPADATTEAPSSTAPEGDTDDADRSGADGSRTPATSTSESAPTTDDGTRSSDSGTDRGTQSGTQSSTDSDPGTGSDTDPGTDPGSGSGTGGDTSGQTGQSTQEPQADAGTAQAEPSS